MKTGIASALAFMGVSLFVPSVLGFNHANPGEISRVAAEKGMEKRFSPFKGAINPLDDNEEGCGRVNHYGAYYATIQESKFSPFDENGKSSTCNTCIKLFGVNEVVVEVIGICEGCENNSLEISDKAMEDLTGGKEIDLGEIEWKYIACPSK